MSQTTTTLAVDGMSCEGCENSIQSALGALDGVSAVDASHEAKTVKVDHDADVTDEAALRDAIEDIGFEPI
jgi:copper chaperone